MADFDVIVPFSVGQYVDNNGVTLTYVKSGPRSVDWLDPRLEPPFPPELPLWMTVSRLNSRPGYPQKRLVGAVGVPVVLKAVVDGVVAPLDAALGGRLFVAWTVEAPVLPFVGIAGSFGQSSMQTVTPNQPGHYTIGVRRPDGGLVHVHLDVGSNQGALLE